MKTFRARLHDGRPQTGGANTLETEIPDSATQAAIEMNTATDHQDRLRGEAGRPTETVIARVIGHPAMIVGAIVAALGGVGHTSARRVEN